jgi:hypothetical protein
VGSIAMLAVTGVVYAALPRRERWAGQSADASGQNGAAGTPV